MSLYFLYTLYHATQGTDEVCTHLSLIRNGGILLTEIGDGAWCWVVALVECNVGIMTASMPGVTVFVRWVRGETTEHGKPGAQENKNENDTVGHRGQRMQRRSAISSTGSRRDEEYELQGMTRSHEVLLDVDTIIMKRIQSVQIGM